MKQLQQVPFLASKNLYRVTSYFLQLDQQRVDQFCKILHEVKDNIVLCQVCFMWQEQNAQCVFCCDGARDRSIICVVESWHELLVIERTEGFKGLYHVLGGVISPLDGIGPKDLRIDDLLSRIDDCVKEIFFALNQTPEGEVTVAFIARKLSGKNLVISCLAKGMPVGSNLEFVDQLTVSKALVDRKPF